MERFLSVCGKSRDHDTLTKTQLPSKLSLSLHCGPSPALAVELLTLNLVKVLLLPLWEMVVQVLLMT